eukprot:3820971-Pyramimonas_sp.AAC.1
MTVSGRGTAWSGVDPGTSAGAGSTRVYGGRTRLCVQDRSGTRDSVRGVPIRRATRPHGERTYPRWAPIAEGEREYTR